MKGTIFLVSISRSKLVGLLEASIPVQDLKESPVQGRDTKIYVLVLEQYWFSSVLWCRCFL